MKIVHLSYSDSGGAGKAALRLHQSLLSLGIDSTFVCLIKNSNCEKVYQVSIARQNLLNRILNRFNLRLAKNKYQNQNILEGDYEIFSSPITRYRIEESGYIKNASIIHLHWISNYINFSTFFKNTSGKYIIWTLHDQNPFMGGFHYSSDKLRNKGRIVELDAKYANIKQRMLEKYCSNISIVFLNRWMRNQAHKNRFFNRVKSNIIYNSLDTEVFRIWNKDFSRKVLRLPENKKIILFVSQSINNYRKGFDLLTGAFDLLDKTGLSLVAIGNNPLDSDSIHFLGSVSDERILALAYSAADLFVLPSREDNQPNTVLESLCCGTPVIAFNTGGLEEIIDNGKNGILLDEISIDALATGISEALSNKYIFDKNGISFNARNTYSSKKQAEDFTMLYCNNLILAINDY